MVTLRCTHPQINRNTHTAWMTNTPPQLRGLGQLQDSAQKGDLHPRGRHGWATQSSGSTKPLVLLLLLEVFAITVLKRCHELCVLTVVSRVKHCGPTTHLWASLFKCSHPVFLASTSVSTHRLYNIGIYMVTYIYLIMYKNVHRHMDVRNCPQ